MLPTRDDIGRAISTEEETALLQACGQSRSRSLVPFVTLAIETGRGTRDSDAAMGQRGLRESLPQGKQTAVTTPEQRKQFALYAVAKPPLTPVLFAMLDGKDYAPIIWKMVRPRGDEKTFKVDIDL